MLTAPELIEFEKRVAALFAGKHILGPVHLSGGNEEQLIEIFRTQVKRKDWVFSTWRNHYHALLHGVSPDELLHHLRSKWTMNVCFPERRFYTSAIAGGILPIAAGVAAGLQDGTHVHCFIGDMTAEMGICKEVAHYASSHHLPLTIHVEDNGFSTDTPTRTLWKPYNRTIFQTYTYSRTWPHMQKSPFQGPK